MKVFSDVLTMWPSPYFRFHVRLWSQTFLPPWPSCAFFQGGTLAEGGFFHACMWEGLFLETRMGKSLLWYACMGKVFTWAHTHLPPDLSVTTKMKKFVTWYAGEEKPQTEHRGGGEQGPPLLELCRLCGLVSHGPWPGDWEPLMCKILFLRKICGPS